MKYYMFLAMLPSLIFIIFCVFMAYKYPSEEKPKVEKVGHGIASKIVFEGHSYVVWQQNISDCIVHDPDCPCHSKGK